MKRDVVVRRLGDWHFPPYFGRRIQHSVPFHVFNRLGHCMDRPDRRLSGKAVRCTRIPTGMERHRLVMNCSGQEGVSDRSRKYEHFTVLRRQRRDGCLVCA